MSSGECQAVLVHGAGGGAWEWCLWERELAAAGVVPQAVELRPKAQGYEVRCGGKMVHVECCCDSHGTCVRLCACCVRTTLCVCVCIRPLVLCVHSWIHRQVDGDGHEPITPPLSHRPSASPFVSPSASPFVSPSASPFVGQVTSFQDYVDQVVEFSLAACRAPTPPPGARGTGGTGGTGSTPPDGAESGMPSEKEKEKKTLLVLVGASMGGMVVLKAAERINKASAPRARLAAVVLVCSTVPGLGFRV